MEPDVSSTEQSSSRIGWQTRKLLRRAWDTFVLCLLCVGFSASGFAQPAAAPVFRPDDRRPIRDDQRAAELGIRKYVSRHLILYTDISPEKAATLPALIDQIYPVWTEYFGELPRARDGSDFQMTCYLMQDQSRFTEAGMQPEGTMMSRFGRQIGREFWMLEQQGDYYRRHLLFHEATHAFMTTLPTVLPPLWYLEGMAEFFATHQMDEQGKITFCHFPGLSTSVPEWGRIELIKQENFAQRTFSLHQIGTMRDDQFARPRPVPYAWSWAICAFLDGHPRYRERFRQLGQNLEYAAFQRMMVELFEPDRRLLSAEWREFARRVDYGYDVAASSFQPADGIPWPTGTDVQLSVTPRQGWQSTGLTVEAGMNVILQAEGTVLLRRGTPDWKSEPQGISLAYADGIPIGTLLAGWLPVSSAVGPNTEMTLQVSPVGREATLTAPLTSELWLRVNDRGRDLSKHDGRFTVTLSRQSP